MLVPLASSYYYVLMTSYFGWLTFGCVLCLLTCSSRVVLSLGDVHLLPALTLSFYVLMCDYSIIILYSTLFIP